MLCHSHGCQASWYGSTRSKTLNVATRVLAFNHQSSGSDGKLRPVKMAFALQYRCEFGQNLSILGSLACLGGWNTEQCIDMQWTEDDVWKVEVELPSVSNDAIEYKYVVRGHGGHIVTWKPGDNYMLQVPVEDNSNLERVRIRDAWDNSCRQIEVDLGSVKEMEPKLDSRSQAADMLKEQADAALCDLKKIVDESTAILEEVDPISPEALAADRAVAKAATKVQKLTKALNEYKRSGILRNPDLEE